MKLFFMCQMVVSASGWLSANQVVVALMVKKSQTKMFLFILFFTLFCILFIYSDKRKNTRNLILLWFLIPSHQFVFIRSAQMQFSSEGK